MELLQDPRPLDEKSQVLMREMEDTMVAFLERGADVETDVLSNIKTVLPAEVGRQKLLRIGREVRTWASVRMTCSPGHPAYRVMLLPARMRERG